MAAKSIGELCLDYEIHRERLKKIYDHMPKKWQKSVSGILKELSAEMFSFLTPPLAGQAE